MLKDLFFPVTGAHNDDVVLSTAERIADHHRARLLVAVPATSPPPLATPWGFPPDSGFANILEIVDREAAERGGALRARLTGSKVNWEVRVDRARTFEPARALSLLARYADVSVLARPSGPDSAIAHAFFNAFLFESGRPVLVVPPAMIVRPVRKVLLAWKPTREATRAIHDALALFAPKAAEVLVVDAQRDPFGEEDEPGADIAAHLARHGLAVGVTRMACGATGFAGTVREHAERIDADLIVAGGYGHARAREWVLGGATRGLLESADLPVLFSH